MTVPWSPDILGPMPIPQNIDALVDAALRVKNLRDELARAEAELDRVSRGSPESKPKAKAKDGFPVDRDAIRRLMADGKVWTNEQLGRKLGRPTGEVGDATKRMTDLTKAGPGKYRLKKA